MSIVNITMGKERALVGCDTTCSYDTAEGERFGQMSKLLVLQGMGVVMAYRGQRHMFHQVVNRSLFDQEPECFDALIEQMPRILRDAQFLAGTAPFDMTLELYVVGWSHERGRMTGASYEIDRFGGLIAAHVDTWRSASSPEVPGNPTPVLNSHETMLTYARQQVASSKTEDPAAVIGGRFFIADVTREQILVTCVGNLADAATD